MLLGLITKYSVLDYHKGVWSSLRLLGMFLHTRLLLGTCSMSVTRYVSVRHEFVIRICHRNGTSRMLAAISCNGNLQISERYESTWTARGLMEVSDIVWCSVLFEVKLSKLFKPYHFSKNFF